MVVESELWCTRPLSFPTVCAPEGRGQSLSVELEEAAVCATLSVLRRCIFAQQENNSGVLLRQNLIPVLALTTTMTIPMTIFMIVTVPGMVTVTVIVIVTPCCLRITYYFFAQ